MDDNLTERLRELAASGYAVQEPDLDDWVTFGLAVAEMLTATDPTATLRTRLHKLLDSMFTFAKAAPSRQQTRQKSAREMVEQFAYELKDVLATSAPAQGPLRHLSPHAIEADVLEEDDGIGRIAVSAIREFCGPASARTIARRLVSAPQVASPDMQALTMSTFKDDKSKAERLAPSLKEDLDQAGRILRSWAGARMQISGKWTTQEQVAVDLAIRLEAAALAHTQKEAQP